VQRCADFRACCREGSGILRRVRDVSSKKGKPFDMKTLFVSLVVAISLIAPFRDLRPGKVVSPPAAAWHCDVKHCA
jgi:hypothetical protein